MTKVQFLEIPDDCYIELILQGASGESETEKGEDGLIKIKILKKPSLFSPMSGGGKGGGSGSCY